MKNIIPLVKKYVLFVSVVLVLALLMLLPLRLDLSKNKAYSLSDSSQKVLRSIKKTTTITLFVSSTLPAKITPLKNDVIDLLKEYAKQSRSITFKQVDPKNDSKMKEVAQQEGIPELPFSMVERNSYQVASSYFGVLIESNGKKEVLPQVTDYAHLEYYITSALYRLNVNTLPSVGFVEWGTVGQSSAIKQTLAQLYTVNTLNPDDITEEKYKQITQKNNTVIAIIGPDETLSSQLQIFFKEHLMRKGNLILLADGVGIEEQSLIAAPVKHALNSFIDSYGIRLKDNLVLSANAEVVNFGNQTVQYITAYPYWVKTNAFSPNENVFSNVSSLTFPWVSELTIAPRKNRSVIQLVNSSERSWTIKNPTSAAPSGIKQPSEKALGKSILMARSSSETAGSLVVIGSSRFLSEQYMGQSSGNIEFAINLVDSLASSGLLNGILSRSANYYPLPDLPDFQKDVTKYIAVFLFPLLWSVFGIIRLLRRK